VRIRQLIAVAALLLLTAGAAGCTSSASRGIHDTIQTARCFSAVARAASPGNKQAATVRYALILEACKTKAMLNGAVLRRLGKNGLSFTVGQIAQACDDIKPVPKVCAQLGHHG
jgi:hypothetical protein